MYLIVVRALHPPLHGRGKFYELHGQKSMIAAEDIRLWKSIQTIHVNHELITFLRKATRCIFMVVSTEVPHQKKGN